MSTQLEYRIRDFLSEHLELLEPGLTLVKTEHQLPNSNGAGGRVDILAKDSFGHFVIVEVKRSNSAARQALNEIHKYVALFRNAYGLDRTAVRVIVVSTEWHELLVPFSECLETFQWPIEGISIEAAPDGTVTSVERVRPALRGSGLRFSREQGVYLFESGSTRDMAALNLSAAAKKVGLRDFILIAMDYVGGADIVIYPFALYLVFSSPLAELDDTGKRGLKEALAWEEDLDSPDENFLVAINRAIQDVASIEIGYPEKLRSLSSAWRPSALYRHGRLEQPGSPITDDELIRLAQEVHGGSPIYLHKVSSPRFAPGWRQLREDLATVLVGLTHWQAVVPALFDEVEASDRNATVSISIYNPADLVLGLYTIATEGELSRCPIFELFIESSRDPSVRIITGVLAWDGTPVDDTPDVILTKVYGGVEDWLLIRHMGSAWEYEEQAMAAHRLRPVIVEFSRSSGIEEGPIRVELVDFVLRRSPFDTETNRSLPEFAQAAAGYLASLSDLIDSRSIGLRGR